MNTTTMTTLTFATPTTKEVLSSTEIHASSLRKNGSLGFFFYCHQWSRLLLLKLLVVHVFLFVGVPAPVIATTGATTTMTALVTPTRGNSKHSHDKKSSSRSSVQVHWTAVLPTTAPTTTDNRSSATRAGLRRRTATTSNAVEVTPRTMTTTTTTRTTDTATPPSSSSSLLCHVQRAVFIHRRTIHAPRLQNSTLDHQTTNTSTTTSSETTNQTTPTTATGTKMRHHHDTDSRDDDDDEEDDEEGFWSCEPLVMDSSSGSSSSSSNNGHYFAIGGSYHLELDLLPRDIVQAVIRKSQQQEHNHHDVIVVLEIPGGTLTSDAVVIPHPHQVTLLEEDEGSLSDSPPLPRRISRSTHRQLRKPSSLGALTATLIHISTSDSTPTYGADQVYDLLYHATRASTKRQFESCSFGQLTLLEPAFGVLDIVLSDVSVYDSNVEVKAASLTNWAEQAANVYLSEKYGISQGVRSWTDLLLFVLPPGTGGWAAYATVSGKQVCRATSIISQLSKPTPPNPFAFVKNSRFFSLLHTLHSIRYTVYL